MKLETPTKLIRIKPMRFNPAYWFPIIGAIIVLYFNPLSNFYQHNVLRSGINLNMIPWWIPLWKIAIPHKPIDRRLPSVLELDKDAFLLLDILEDLKQHRFFRIFKVNLSGRCPFWARREMCTDGGSCHVCECDDHQIPQVWKEKPIENFVDRNHYEMSEIESWKLSEWHLFANESPKQLLKDPPESTTVYVDLTLNRPGYTSYKGRNIWRLIYQENCIKSSDDTLEQFHDKRGNYECTEEKGFYRIISGMQTVIMVLASEYHYLKGSPTHYARKIEEMKRNNVILDLRSFRSQYYPNMGLFKDRIAPFEERIENLYFSFGMLLKTLCRLKSVLSTCSCDTGNQSDDTLACYKLKGLLDVPFSTCQDQYIDTPLFSRQQTVALQQFHNISRIMDCLECEKCRLHGKVKILALQLTLRTLGNSPRLYSVERNELIALINALGYYSDAIFSIKLFKRRLLYLQIIWIFFLLVSIGSVIVFFKFNTRAFLKFKKKCKAI